MNGSQGKSYRVGVIGFAHMHVNELVDRFAATGRSPIVACADTVPRMPSLTRVEGSRQANLGRALALPSNPRRYEDYRELLAAERLDIVILCPENARHSEIAQEVAELGAHVVAEKPMAATLDGARSMAAAAKKSGVTLAVNWPIVWSPAFRMLKKLVRTRRSATFGSSSGAILPHLARSRTAVCIPGTPSYRAPFPTRKRARNGGIRRARAEALCSTIAATARAFPLGSFRKRRPPCWG